MRMMVISFIVILIILFIWFWFHFSSIEVVTSYYSENLRELKEMIKDEDWDKANVEIVKYNDKWQEFKKPWVYFLNQNDVNNIDISFKRLEIYIKNSNKIMAQAELEQLFEYFYVIKENECLSWDNIF